ncbi:uncharacterized protein ARMOST_04881 [Armillaria ostoyae]|uniref:Uncharacterized protein n=1 Tax=Armillaria ostoyae TaxID=47428 RepID=A0A284QYL1_ARMOS|nr:uncharacterized protein ARMOST_04881 [Armillaria ostoyae]
MLSDRTSANRRLRLGTCTNPSCRSRVECSCRHTLGHKPSWYCTISSINDSPSHSSMYSPRVTLESADCTYPRNLLIYTAMGSHRTRCLRIMGTYTNSHH